MNTLGSHQHQATRANQTTRGDDSTRADVRAGTGAGFPTMGAGFPDRGEFAGRLTAEFSGQVAPAAVIQVVQDCRAT